MANFTKQAIKTSFLKLLNEKPLNKITVRDIVEDCGINRNSFYYHFQDIPALLGEIIAEQTEQMIREYPTVESIEQCFEAAFRFARENRRAVMHIYDSVSRNEFTAGALKLCGHVVRRYVFSLDIAALPEFDRESLIRAIKCQLYGMFVDWITSGMDDMVYHQLQRGIMMWQGVPERLARSEIDNSNKNV